MKKSIVAVALAVIFVMALAAPAFAITHSVTYEMDGVIDFRKQAGHECNTGGVWKQTITGSGEMSKVTGLYTGWKQLIVNDTNDYVAGATALTVTSVIELCMPPKYVYDGFDMFGNRATMPVHNNDVYGTVGQPGTFRGFGPGADTRFPFGPWNTTHEQLARAYGWEALTDQIWAVQVQADPGFSGNLHQDFTAAHGGYVGNRLNPYPYDWRDLDWYEAGTAWDWAWKINQWGWASRVPGPEFAGSFFDIEQMARTSQGTIQRYIDISDPIGHGYLHEDMSIVGKAEISESFNNVQIPAGADAHRNWWDIF